MCVFERHYVLGWQDQLAAPPCLDLVQPLGPQATVPPPPALCLPSLMRRTLFFILTALYCLFAVNQALQFKQVRYSPGDTVLSPAARHSAAIPRLSNSLLLS